MKGVIFNLLEQVVTENFGPDTWDDLIEESGVDGAYTSLGNYGDHEIEALVAAASAKTGMSRGEVLHWFGVRAMPHLRTLYPALFEGHPSSRSFALSINEMIHPEVHKLYPDAKCPFFHLERRDARTVSMKYESEREMLDLAEGFLEGAAILYGDTASVERDPVDRKGKLLVRWE